jgi:O-acetyl-ADP-ribose deacetylase (regulator of RNase III)
MSFDIVLGDIDGDICHAWRTRFRDRRVAVEHGDFFDIEADAYVSPANSHGIMDGGFDLLLRIRFPGVDVVVQREIDRLGGLLPVGNAIVVETGDYDVPYLVCAPTMVVPTVIAGTNNVYRAMLGLLRAVNQFNLDFEDPIQTLAIPGLGTGVGKMSPSSAAEQMHEAYQMFLSEG